MSLCCLSVWIGWLRVRVCLLCVCLCLFVRCLQKKDVIPLDEDDIALIKSYGSGPYTASIKSTEDDIARLTKEVNSLKGIKESDTGLAPPSMWDLVADKQLMGSEQPLQVARVTKIISPGTEDAKYLINVKASDTAHTAPRLVCHCFVGSFSICRAFSLFPCQTAKACLQYSPGQRCFDLIVAPFPLHVLCTVIFCVVFVQQIAKYVVGLAERVSPTDIEESMRVGVDRSGKYQIHIPLPPKIDPSVTMMTVEEKPDVSYADVGGSKEQIEKIREVVELPMLNPERFINLGIDPPKGVLLYGPPGTGQRTGTRTHRTRTKATAVIAEDDGCSASLLIAHLTGSALICPVCLLLFLCLQAKLFWLAPSPTPPTRVSFA